MGDDGVSDLVKRLRIRGLESGRYDYQEAADKIEQLERELADLKAAIFGGDNYWKELSNGNFVEMAQILHSALKGGLARAEKAEAELAAEKALADRLYIELQHSGVLASLGMIDYRKARGL